MLVLDWIYVAGEGVGSEGVDGGRGAWFLVLGLD